MVKKTTDIKDDTVKKDNTIGGGFPPIIINDTTLNLLRSEAYSIDKILPDTNVTTNTLSQVNLDNVELISITCL